mgnify:CR=1 FL=1
MKTKEAKDAHRRPDVPINALFDKLVNGRPKFGTNTQSEQFWSQ